MGLMAKYRKKPVVVEARQLTDDMSVFEEIAEWAGADYVWDEDGPPYMIINTHEGDMRAMIGDWIICGIKGEFYPCRPDIFEATYERDYVDED